MKNSFKKTSKLTKIAYTLLLIGSTTYFYLDGGNQHISYAQTLELNHTPTEQQIQTALSKFMVKPQDTPAVVRITVDTPAGETKYTSSGTGFFITPLGHLVTNSHVVKSDYAIYRVKIDEKAGEPLVARVVYRDTLYDLAILKVEGANFPYLNLVTYDEWKTFDTTQKVTAVGHPYGLEDDFVYTGSILGLDEAIYLQQGGDPSSASYTKYNKLVSTGIELSPGDSGGPLLDGTQKVIGVSVATSILGDKKSFMIPATAVRRIVNKLKIPLPDEQVKN